MMIRPEIKEQIDGTRDSMAKLRAAIMACPTERPSFAPQSPAGPTDLRRLADIYAANRGIALSTLGNYAAGNGRFFSRLSEGKTITLKRVGRVITWFSMNWPEDLEWPSDIPRPTPSEEAE